jgi:hypothetical protein
MMRDGLIYSGGFPMANQDSFQRTEELSILRPRIEGIAELCAGSAVCKRSGGSEVNTSHSLEKLCSKPSMPEDVLRVDWLFWRATQSEFRYRGEPNVIDLGEL